MSKKFIVFLAAVLVIAAFLSWLISLDSKKEAQQTAAPQETIAVQQGVPRLKQSPQKQRRSRCRRCPTRS